ncbi:MAG: response regulator [Thermodesulfobacteriota bacterium]
MQPNSLPQVLIVDDDRELLGYVGTSLQKFRDRFSVVEASDGLAAQEQLRRHRVSLVVTDLKMPRVDGLGLLAYVMAHYPDVPVIVLTAVSTPELERAARRGGAIAYLEKPFLVSDLAEKILTALERQADGGTLHGVSSGMFLQLIRLEQRTCTIRLAGKDTERHGALFFLEGELVDARAGDLQGEAAAHEIFRWKEVNLTIQNLCAADHPRRISASLEALLLDAMRRGDEAARPRAEGQPRPAGGTDPATQVRALVDRALGERSGVLDIYLDPEAQARSGVLGELGERLGLGRLRAAHFSRHSATDAVVLPGAPPITLQVDRKANTARLLQVLMEAETGPDGSALP